MTDESRASRVNACLQGLEAGVPAWLDETVVECFRARGRGAPWKRLWALAVALRRPGLLPASELAGLLDAREPLQRALAARLTADATPWGLPPEIIDAATVLAGRAPRGKTSSTARRLALEILAKSRRAGNLEILARALRDGSREDRLFALEAITRSRLRAGADVIRSAIEESSMDTPVLLDAIGALLSLEAADALEELVPVVHRRLVEEGEFSWVDLLLSLERIGASLDAADAITDFFTGDSRKEPWAELFPQDDAAAASQAMELISPEVRRSLRRYATGNRPRSLVIALADLLRAALDQAAARNPDFAGLARSIRVLTDRACDTERLDQLDEEQLRSLSALLGVLLGMALRGRRIDVELEAALADPVCDARRIDDLLEVDEAWIPVHALSTIARRASPERLARLASSEHRFVAANARVVLATLEPKRWLGPALDTDDGMAFAYTPLLREAIRLGAESALEVVTERFVNDPTRDANADDLALSIAATGTSRARAMLVASFDHLVVSNVARKLIFDAIVHAGTEDLARRFLRAVEEGTIELLDTEFMPIGRFALLAQVCLLHGRFDLEGRPRDIALAGIRQGRLQADEWLNEEGWEEDEQYDRFEGFEEYDEYEAPDAPIRRDTTKVGRNDPCPCGSGKKFKKCCGG